MNRKTIASILAIIIVVALVGVAAYTLTPKAESNDGMGGMDHGSQQSTSTESATYKEYAALMGEDFDRKFLPAMIAHHEGAVDMANLAANQAKHAELQAMAQEIIKAQNKEITGMANWQQQWNYPASSGGHAMGHDATSMQSDMATMTNQLKGLSGDDFDKKFLELMIEHHQSAIDMAKPGQANAYHQEVKNISKAIVQAQTREISQMQAWQKDWGYKN